MNTSGKYSSTLLVIVSVILASLIIVFGGALLPSISTPRISPQQSEVDNVVGYLRGGRVMYLRKFIDGIPVENIILYDDGTASIGPYSEPGKFPPPDYITVPLSQDTQVILTKLREEWCKAKTQPSIDDLPNNRYNIGYICGKFQPGFLILSEDAIPFEISELLRVFPDRDLHSQN